MPMPATTSLSTARGRMGWICREYLDRVDPACSAIACYLHSARPEGRPTTNDPIAVATIACISRRQRNSNLSRMVIAVVAMFLQQTCGSIGRVLPAVLAPLIIQELDADPSWVGVYFGLTAIAALIGQLGSGGFI